MKGDKKIVDILNELPADPYGPGRGLNYYPSGANEIATLNVAGPRKAAATAL